MKDVREWLDSIGCGQYADAFLENDLDWSLLPELDQDTLKDIGVHSAGHRLRILKALRTLDEPRWTESPPEDETKPARGHSPASRGEAERRQLTIMFADLVGSTELSRQLDPEELRELNRTYQDAAKEAIEQYGGYVARYMGDGVLAYFGYPQAHEDDAERAVRGGIELLASLDALNAPTELSVRVGIATGPVVVGDLIGEGASQENAVVGETPNLAARLEGFARPGTVVISEATRSLLGPHIDVLQREANIKGFPSGLTCFEVRDVRGLRHGDAAPNGALAGRDEELGLLTRRWQQATESDGQVVLLCGEPGVGKSNLVQALQRQIATSDVVEIRYFCSPYHRQSALHPVIEQLREYFDLDAFNSDQSRFREIEARVDEAGLGSTDAATYLGSLLAVQSHAELGLADSNELRQRSIAAVADWLLALTRGAPMLLVVEDLHWIDPTTLELLGEVVERVRQEPILALFTYRPEFSPPWATAPHLTVLTLNNLPESACREIVNSVDRAGVLTEPVISAILHRADGVPLFVEELTKSVIESQAALEAPSGRLPGTSASAEIPSSLQDSLVARLDRLGEAKEVAQLGAVIGRQFNRDLLLSVSGWTADRAEGALTQLCESGLTYRRRLSGSIWYEFKHALVRDAAYGTLLHTRRREYHRRVACALSTTTHDRSELAKHWLEAERYDEAARAYVDAGDATLARGSPREAEDLFRSGLESHSRWDESAPPDDELEFRLQSGLALSTMQSHGFAAPALGPASLRAIDLAERADDMDAILRLMDLHLSFLFGTGEPWDNFDALCDRFLPRAKEGRDPRHVARAHFLEARAAQADHRGGVKTMVRESKRAISVCKENPSLSAELAPTLASAQRALGVANGRLGLLDQELTAVTEGLAVAAEYELGYAETILLFALADSRFRRWEYSQLTEIGARGYEMALERGYNAHAINFRGYWGEGLCGNGQADEAVPLLKQALEEALRSRVSRFVTARIYCHLVGANARTGDIAEAVRVMGEATEYYERVLRTRTPRHMLRYLLTKADLAATARSIGDQSLCLEPEEAYRSVIDAATPDDSYWTIPATIGLAEVLRSMGRDQEATEQLVRLRRSFSEGMDTPIMRYAQTLLDELRSAANRD